MKSIRIYGYAVGSENEHAQCCGLAGVAVFRQRTAGRCDNFGHSIVWKASAEGNGIGHVNPDYHAQQLRKLS